MSSTRTLLLRVSAFLFIVTTAHAQFAPAPTNGFANGFDPYGMQSPYNTGFMQPNNGFLPPDSQAFLPPPPSGGGTGPGGSVGGPQDLYYQSQFAMPVANQFYDKKRADFQAQQQFKMLGYSMMAQKAAMQSQAAAANAPCYAAQTQAMDNSFDRILHGFLTMSANNNGQSICPGGGVMGIQGQPAMGGMGGQFPANAGSPYSSLPLELTQAQNQMGDLQKEQLKLQNRELDLQNRQLSGQQMSGMGNFVTDMFGNMAKMSHEMNRPPEPTGSSSYYPGNNSFGPRLDGRYGGYDDHDYRGGYGGYGSHRGGY